MISWSDSFFIALFDSTLAESLQTPVTNLMDALYALDHNNVQPILRPVARPGAAPSSPRYESLQGHAAGTVMRLRKSGHPPLEARELVAKKLTKLGVRPSRGSGSITAETIRHWCDEVTRDANRVGQAAKLYDSMFADEEASRFRLMEP